MARQTTTEGAGFRLLPTTRLDAFSDGVFAIVITLLVLELDVPDSPENLLGELVDGWAGYLGYVVSYAFIGGLWISHANATRYMAATNAVLLRLNLVLLLFVSFLPFTTSLLTTHLDDTGAPLAVILFGVNLTLASLMLNVVVGYMGRTPELTVSDAADVELRAFERERRIAVATLAAATLVGVLFPVAAVVFYLIITIVILIVPLRHARRWRTR